MNFLRVLNGQPLNIWGGGVVPHYRICSLAKQGDSSLGKKIVHRVEKFVSETLHHAPPQDD